jgi:predicted RNase H-like nuclease
MKFWKGLQMDTYIGFDSAWTNKSPGAICAVVVEDRKPVRFHTPELVTFDGALEFIERFRQGSMFTLVALDQPTLVPNATGMRPVERVAASVISWMGGGVQPANTGKLGMFCHSSPIWGFLQALNAIQDPEEAQGAIKGVYLIEVFPALALASLEPKFFARLGAPKYNPTKKKKFRKTDWKMSLMLRREKRACLIVKT